MTDGMHIEDIPQKPQKQGSFLVEILKSLAIAIVLALFIRTFLLQTFYIPSESMVPTLKINDHVIADKISYRFSDPRRGDIIVFMPPLPSEKYPYVKRLIGLPGETVELKDNRVYINGEPIEEKYLPEGLKFRNYGPVTVPDNSYFMMGDNRNNSSDSRVWGFLPEKMIIGKAVVLYWPLDRVRLLTSG
ncbi:MAG: signal peptidase I [Bacillota bacterium]